MRETTNAGFKLSARPAHFPRASGWGELVLYRIVVQAIDFLLDPGWVKYKIKNSIPRKVPILRRIALVVRLIPRRELGGAST